MPQKMALQNYAINIKLFLFNGTAVKPGISKHVKIEFLLHLKVH